MGTSERINLNRNGQFNPGRNNRVSSSIVHGTQVYMQRGVEKMNSLEDPRESYFKNKVTGLMTKQTVIRSLKENPMKKKSKPGQVATTQIKHKNEPKAEQMVELKKKQQKPDVNHFQLKEKRRQLQMRMAYVTEEHGPESLKKIIAQQDNREQNITKKITNIINSHEQRLNERIRARKLKTATFRSRSEVNMQENAFGQFGDYEKQQEPKIFMESMDPFQKLLEKRKIIEQKLDKEKDDILKSTKKRHKSLYIERPPESPQKRTRKYTHDKINPKKSFS